MLSGKIRHSIEILWGTPILSILCQCTTEHTYVLNQMTCVWEKAFALEQLNTWLNLFFRVGSHPNYCHSYCLCLLLDPLTMNRVGLVSFEKPHLYGHYGSGLYTTLSSLWLLHSEWSCSALWQVCLSFSDHCIPQLHPGDIVKKQFILTLSFILIFQWGK